MSKQSKDSKDLIVDAAMSLFAKQGYENVTVKDICDLAGIPRSSFYLRFANKADILAYQLEIVKVSFQQKMPEFLRAENDFERIWFLTDAYLQQAVEFGPDICRAYFSLELNSPTALFYILEDFNDWLIQLTFNCQKQGLIRNQINAAELVPMQLDLAKATLFRWVCTNGAFPLRETVRNRIELFLDVVK